jgi:hypothetical protein
MKDPLEQLRKQTLEIPYDGPQGRTARCHGPGKPWDLFWQNGRSDGTCAFDDILEHWFDRSGLDNQLLEGFVRLQFPKDCREQRLLTEHLASQAGAAVTRRGDSGPGCEPILARPVI